MGRWIAAGVGLGALALVAWGLVWLELALRDYDRYEQESNDEGP